MEIPSGVFDFLRRALEEDIGPGDITTDLLIPAEHTSRAHYLAKSDFVLAGIPFVNEVFRLLDPSLSFRSFFREGESIQKGAILAEVSGKTSGILAGERVSLNLLQRLSGISTLTRIYRDLVQGCTARIVDTRKTTPGLRFMEKYAVKTGGGSNHRFGLFDGILIKDNHISAAGGIQKAVFLAKKAHHLMRIEIEVQTVQELKEAIEAGADIVMLDNMSVDEIKASVTAAHGRVLLEASGGVTLENVRAIAETGVDFISVGALTHSAPAVDISLKIMAGV
ncbi:MAG: carboxylating nicotinate-nucleotide diphosphorylase [Thermodesulfovibrionales bacterium]|nr:carboxylating nicotinate-nucleotide diphosphorylase [Thermodesulfovibrionales bacterium]